MVLLALKRRQKEDAVNQKILADLGVRILLEINSRNTGWSPGTIREIVMAVGINCHRIGATGFIEVLGELPRTYPEEYNPLWGVLRRAAEEVLVHFLELEKKAGDEGHSSSLIVALLAEENSAMVTLAGKKFGEILRNSLSLVK